jgi:hypothetical protein
VGLDIFCVVWKNMPAGVVLILAIRGGRLVVAVPLATEAVVFLLDNATNEGLTSPTDYWLMRKSERRLVILF